MSVGASDLENGISRQGAQDQWRASFGQSPPKHLSTGFMQRAIGWEAQAKAASGIPANVRRSLQAIACGGSVSTLPSNRMSAGTHLVREWNGRTYQVEVLGKGFVMDGRKYRSLSAIAKYITGTNWSGPRFFGLNRGKS